MLLKVKWSVLYLLWSWWGELASCPALRTNCWSAPPPTEAPGWWLGPPLSASHLGWILWWASQTKTCLSVSLHYICWAAVCWANMLNCEAVKKSQPCVFSAVTLEKSDTWDTATKGSPSSWRKTPMMKAVSSHSYPPDRDVPGNYLIVAPYYREHVIKQLYLQTANTNLYIQKWI